MSQSTEKQHQSPHSSNSPPTPQQSGQQLQSEYPAVDTALSTGDHLTYSGRSTHHDIQRGLNAAPMSRRRNIVLNLQSKLGNQAVLNLLREPQVPPDYSEGLQIPRLSTQTADAQIQRKSEAIGDFKITGRQALDGVLYVRGMNDDHKIHPSDIDQGPLYDCFAMAAFAAVARQRPELIENAIQPPGDSAKGVYTVTFYKRAKKAVKTDVADGLQDKIEFEEHKIPVTAVFPVATFTDSEGNERTGRLNAATTEVQEIGDTHIKLKSTELWAAVLEKAYGIFLNKFEGGYDSFREGGNAGDVLEALSGKPTKTIDPAHALVTDLGRMLDEGYAITLSTYDRDNDPLKDTPSMRMPLTHWHVYYLTSIDAELNVIKIRDPGQWGEEIIVPEKFLASHFRTIYANPLK